MILLRDLRKTLNRSQATMDRWMKVNQIPERRHDGHRVVSDANAKVLTRLSATSSRNKPYVRKDVEIKVKPLTENESQLAQLLKEHFGGKREVKTELQLLQDLHKATEKRVADLESAMVKLISSLA